VNIEKIEYGGWANCWRVTNGIIEAVVTADVGPRVMRYGFVGGQNFFKEFAEQMGSAGRRFVAENYSWSSAANVLNSLYHSMAMATKEHGLAAGLATPIQQTEVYPKVLF